MLWIVSILIGVVLGQHLKISVSPELQAFVKTSWAQAESKGLPMAQSAVEQIKATASKQVKRIGAKSDLDDAEQRFLNS